MTSEQSQVSKPAGVRVRLCLEENMVACGPYLEARMVDQLEVSGSWLVALIVIVTLLTLLALLIAIKCISVLVQRKVIFKLLQFNDCIFNIIYSLPFPTS